MPSLLPHLCVVLELLFLGASPVISKHSGKKQAKIRYLGKNNTTLKGRQIPINHSSPFLVIDSYTKNCFLDSEYACCLGHRVKTDAQKLA